MSSPKMVNTALKANITAKAWTFKAKPKSNTWTYEVQAIRSEVKPKAIKFGLKATRGQHLPSTTRSLTVTIYTRRQHKQSE